MSDEKGLPMERVMTEKQLSTREYITQKVGQCQAFEFIAQLSQIQIAQIIADLHEGGKYKEFGYPTFEALCEAFRISRKTGYRLLDNIKSAGPEIMELMNKAGLSIRAQYELLHSGEIEDAEFEVIDPEKGEVKIRGTVVLVKDSPDLITATLSRMQRDQQVARRALRDAEAEARKKAEELAAQKDENKKLTEKIKKGEDDRIAMEMGEFENKLLDLVLACGKLRTTEWTARDERKAKQYWSTVCSSVIEPLKSFFDSKHYELEEREMESAPDAEDESDNVEVL